MRKAVLSFSLILLASVCFPKTAQGQLLRYCTSMSPGSSGSDTINIGLQSLADTAVPIRAISFSFVFDSTCTDFDTYLSIIEGAGLWGNFLAKDSLQKALSIQYQGKSYNTRYFYGNADPRPSQPNPIIIPASDQQPLVVFRAIFQGSCPPEIYIESQSENPVNQIGSVDNNAIPFDVGLFACAPVSVDPKEDLALNMYPNPTSGKVHFQHAGPLVVELIDQKGRLILKDIIQGQSTLEIKEKGLFLVKISDNKGRSAIKKLLIY
jgi:hypothetical protein